MARYPSGADYRGMNLNSKLVYAVLAIVIVGLGSFAVWRMVGKGGEGEGQGGGVNVAQNEGGVPEDITEADGTVLRPDANSVFVTPITAVTTDANSRVEKIIEQALGLIDARPSRVIEARDLLRGLLAIPMSEGQLTKVKNLLSKLADSWLFSKTIYPQDSLCGSYTVKRGDSLEVIGTKNRVPWECLKDINKMAGAQSLRAGAAIKVVNGPFHAKVYLSKRIMDVYLQDTYVRSFPVGVGKANSETPTGLWRVRSNGKLVSPPWPDPVTKKLLHPGDAGYALGSRWIGLEGLDGKAKGREGFGIHGTHEPESVGQAGSRGCIRLHNGDAIFVYNLLIGKHSRVEIVE